LSRNELPDPRKLIHFQLEKSSCSWSFTRGGGEATKRKRHTEEQIAYALRQAESGTKIIEICRKMGVSEQTFYTWRRKYAV
jgi:hypothetical protein